MGRLRRKRAADATSGRTRRPGRTVRTSQPPVARLVRDAIRPRHPVVIERSLRQATVELAAAPGTDAVVAAVRRAITRLSPPRLRRDLRILLATDGVGPPAGGERLCQVGPLLVDPATAVRPYLRLPL